LAALCLISGWAIAQTDLAPLPALSLWVGCLILGAWTARWSLRPHWIEADGADGLQLVWPGHGARALVHLQVYGPCWMLHAGGAGALRRAAALSVLWPSALRREFRRRWALRPSDPMRRDSAPSV
jgi:hypothetical protein